MRKAFLLAAVLSVTVTMHAQQPFAEYGYRVKRVATFSGGRYDEFHDRTRIVEIGSVKFDTKTGKIVGYVEQNDSIDGGLEAHTVSRFLTMDPLAEKYYSISPYVYCNNNPVLYIDPDGKDWYSYNEEYIDDEGNTKNRTQYKYVEGQMSKKEMTQGGYTHLGKTYTNGNDYYSLFGKKVDLQTESGLLYQKVDKAIINYAEAQIENMNRSAPRNHFETEDVVNHGYTDFTINAIQGKTNFSYEDSFYGVYINFTGKGMNRAKKLDWIGDSDMPKDVGSYLSPRKMAYHIRFQNTNNGDPIHLKYNKNEATILLRKFYNLFPQLKK